MVLLGASEHAINVAAEFLPRLQNIYITKSIALGSSSRGFALQRDFLSANEAASANWKSSKVFVFKLLPPPLQVKHGS